MVRNQRFDSKAILAEAEASESKETYRTVEATMNYRIGIGVRVQTPKSPSFFIEIQVFLCPIFHSADLTILEKNLRLLKQLQMNGFALTCHDGNCLVCEKIVSEDSISPEYTAVKSFISKFLGI